MFNNTTTFGSGSGAVVPTSATTVPNTVFPGNIVTTNATFIIIGPPPPFPAPPRSIDLSPLKLIFAVIAIVAVPTLAYALFFAVPCSSDRRRSSSSRRSNSTRSSSDDLPDELPPSITPKPDSGDKNKNKPHSKEIGDECSICLSVIADGEEIRQLSECKHEFHASCLEKWFKDKPNPNCPICRIDVPVKEQTEANVTVNINGNVNRGGRNPRVTASYRDDDWRQGLPDASSLV